jgi:pimeloyl-ACP methyl ester carboxylesterase
MPLPRTRIRPTVMNDAPAATPAPSPEGAAAKRPWRRFARAVTAVFGGAAVVLASGLALWDGGVDDDPRRQLLPGVTMDLKTVETTRGSIEYDLYGTDGPVVLSVHGGLGGADQGRLFASWLQNDGFRLLSPSRPGYLGTPLSSGRTVEQQADLLAALLDELQIERVGVFAVSSGSPVATTFAARHPERVWGLVTIGGVSRANPDAAPGSGIRRTFLNTVGQKVAALTARVSLETIVAGTLKETSTFTAKQSSERVEHITGHAPVKAFFEAMFDTTLPYEKRWPGTDNDTLQTRHLDLPLERIAAPTLMVHGTQDGDVPIEDSAYAATQIRAAQHYWAWNDDHLGFWLSPRSADLQHIVRTFLQEHAPPA